MIINKSKRSLEASSFFEGSSVVFHKNNAITCNELIEAPYIFCAKSLSYSETDSREYLTRTHASVGWSDSEVAGKKGNAWKAGNKVTMCILTNNNKCLFSDNTVTGYSSLQPIPGTLKEILPGNFSKLILHGENYDHTNSNPGYININGVQSNTQGRGQTLFAINKSTMKVDSSIYRDTYESISPCNDLGNWAEARLNEGYVVASSSFDASSMGGKLASLLRNYGCIGVYDYTSIRTSEIFILQKGLSGAENHYFAFTGAVSADLTVPFFKDTGLIPPRDVMIGSNNKLYFNEFIEI